MATANDEQSGFWEALAPDWLAAERHTEMVSTPFGVAAMERLGLHPGERVLDVGCGSGSTTVELARRTGSDGSAVGVDIAPSMIAAAAEHAATAGVENATFAVADAQTDSLGSPPFDAVFSRFGVMFFSDPTQAFVNIRSGMRPAGRLAFACWDQIFANEWMFVPGAAVVSVTGALPPMPGPGAPGPFSLSEVGVVEGLLTGAGFTHVEATPYSHPVVLPESELESLIALSRRVGPVREALRTVDADTAERIDEAVRAALRERLADGVVQLSAAALIVTAIA